MNDGSRLLIGVSRATKALALGMAIILAVGMWSIVGPIPRSSAHFDVGTTSTTINHDGTAFFGQVTSNRRRCKRGRAVRLIKLRRNRPNRVIARDTSNRFGNWRIKRPRANGRFRVRIRYVRTVSYGHNHRCRATRSTVMRVRR